MLESVAYSTLIVGGLVTAVGMAYHYRVTRCVGGIWAALYAINNALVGSIAWWSHEQRVGQESLLWALWPLVLFTAYTAIRIFLLGWRYSR